MIILGGGPRGPIDEKAFNVFLLIMAVGVLIPLVIVMALVWWGG